MSCSNNILKTSQLFDSYGAKCNSRYFINYGFTLDNNQSFNQAIVNMSSSSLNERFVEFIGESMSYDDGYSGFDQKLDTSNRFQVSTINENIQSGHNSGKRNVLQCISSMFTFARMLSCKTETEVDIVCEYLESKKSELLDTKNNMDPRQMMEFFQRPLAWYNLKVISFENERRAINLISNCCKSELLKFPTTLEEDVIRREEKCQRFTVEYNIQNMLISEKEVLNYYIELNDAIQKTSFKKLRSNEKFKTYYKLFCSKPNDFLITL
jgi:histone-lysine N-methyltransferase SETD3